MASGSPHAFGNSKSGSSEGTSPDSSKRSTPPKAMPPHLDTALSTDRTTSVSDSTFLEAKGSDSDITPPNAGAGVAKKEIDAKREILSTPFLVATHTPPLSITFEITESEALYLDFVCLLESIERGIARSELHPKPPLCFHVSSDNATKRITITDRDDARSGEGIKQCIDLILDARDTLTRSMNKVIDRLIQKQETPIPNI